MISNGSYQTYVEIHKFDNVNEGQIADQNTTSRLLQRGPVLLKFSSSSDAMSAKAKALELETEYILVFNGIISFEGTLDSYEFKVRRNYNDMTLVPIDYPVYLGEITEVHCLEQEDEGYSKNTENSMGTW